MTYIQVLCNMSASQGLIMSCLLSSDQTWSYKLKYISSRKIANLQFRKLKLEFVMSMTSTCWRLFNMHSFDDSCWRLFNMQSYTMVLLCDFMIILGYKHI